MPHNFPTTPPLIYHFTERGRRGIIETNMKKLTTLKNMGNGLIRVSKQTETLTPTAIAAAHAQSQQDGEQITAAQQSPLIQTMPKIKRIPLIVTIDDLCK